MQLEFNVFFQEKYKIFKIGVMNLQQDVVNEN